MNYSIKTIKQITNEEGLAEYGGTEKSKRP